MSDIATIRSTTPVAIDKARFDREMARLLELKRSQPTRRAVDPLATSPDLVRGVVAAAEEWSTREIATALAIGKSTIHEWSYRVRRADGEPPLALRRGDPDLIAIGHCVEALDPLDENARQRVLNYLDERYFGKARTR